MRKLLKFVFLFCILAISIFPQIGLSQKKITLTIQDYFDPGTGMAKFIDKSAEEFMKKYPNVEIKHVYIPFAQLLPTILQQSLTKTLPEIVMADNPWVPQLIKAGVYKDITDKVKEWGWENWEDFYKGHRDVTSYEGRIYALQIYTNNLALFYRKSLLDKAGVKKIPETWTELTSVCKQIKDKLGIYGLGFCATASEEGTWQFEPFLWSNGGSLLELSDIRAIRALQFLTDLVQKGYAPRDVVNVAGQGDVTMWFINGQVAMMINGNWEFGWHLTDDVLIKLGDVGVAKIPVPLKGMRPVVPFGGECYGISSTISPEKYDIAWEFMKYIFSADKMLEANIMHGGLPTRASIAEKILKYKPILKPFLEQAKYALPRPLVGGFEKYPEISAILWSAIQKALTGAKTPESALKEADSLVKKLFTPKEYVYYRDLARKLLTEARIK
jgi:multiple sugar transport system substrate-binding protein